MTLQEIIDKLLPQVGHHALARPTMQRLAADLPEFIPLSQFRREVDIVRDIYNSAWSQNWNFTPFTSAELEIIATEYKMFVDTEIALVAEVDGKPAAMCFAIPDVNEMVKDFDGEIAARPLALRLQRLCKSIREGQLGGMHVVGRRAALQRRLGDHLVKLIVAQVVADAQALDAGVELAQGQVRLIDGAFLIEVVFSLDGLGLLSFESVMNRDYPVMFGTLYIFTLVGLVLKIVSDVTYMLIDPRIDFERRDF